MEKVTARNYDCFLCKPPATTNYFKNLYDERINIICNVLKKNIYPTFEEILIYENKRFLSYWLKAKKIPHPETTVFYNKKEALDFSESITYPIVGKTSIGATASGVEILKNKKELKKYIKRAFSDKGIKRRIGPNMNKGEIKKRIFNRLKNIPQYIQVLYNRYKTIGNDNQKWFVILQKYHDISYEWRVVKIGDSYFAHKKLPRDSKFISGTSKVGWENPPEDLLYFVKCICDKNNLYSQAVDIFVDNEKGYLVNELQCFFGSKNPHQMIINGKPGRYLHKDGNWIFEKGNFNTNNSYDLRVENIMKLIDKKLQRIKCVE